MKEGKKAADVEKALQHWTSSVIDPQLKPVQAKTRQLAEAALSLASSLESRCREFIRNTKYDMSGLGDSRRLRAAMALNRVSGEIVTASGDFLKTSPNESISKLETSITRLLRAAGSSYNESVKAMASHYASERGWLRAEIEGLQRINHQTSQFRTRTRDITSIRDQIQERSKTLVENLTTLQNLENSHVQLEKEIHQLAYNEGSLLEAIERIESNSEIRALNAKESELKPIQKEAREAVAARSQILRSPKVRKLRSQRSDLRAEYTRSRASKQSLESKMKSIAEEASSLKAQAKTHLDTIDELAMKNFNKGVPRELREEVLSLTH